MIFFRVNAVPVAQPRQRHRIVKSGQHSFVSNYTPAKAPVNTFKAAVQAAAIKAHGCVQLTGPLRLTLVYLMPRTKGMIWKKKPMPRTWHFVRPDFDNLCKSLCDALKSIVWVDDTQICDVVFQKWYASGDESPGVEVTIEQLKEN